MDELARLKILYSEDKINKLKNQKIMLFGLGGVGGYVLETLARSGISSFVIIDGDIIEESNINRQIIATKENIGESKVNAFKKRFSHCQLLNNAQFSNALGYEIIGRTYWKE